MRDNRPGTLSRILAIACAVAALTGCESEAGKELRKRPRSRESSSKLALPPGGAWSSAVVVTVCGSFERQRSGRGGIGKATVYFVRTTLVLAGTDGGETLVPVMAGTHESEDAAGILEAADLRWRLAAPGDGRGVAYSPEGVEEWRWVALERSAPFACPHLVLDAKGGDPCSAAPTWHDMAMRFAGPEGGHPDGPPDFAEWSALATLAAADPADPAVLRALGTAALREGSGLFLESLDAPALLAIQRDAASSPLRDAARLALSAERSTGTVLASNAALLLSLSPAEDDLGAVTRALVARDWSPVGKALRDSHWPRALAWTAARMITARGNLPAAVEADLLACVVSTSVSNESRLPLVAVLAARGSPETIRKLTDLAATGPGAATGGKADPSWPADLEELWKAGVVDHGAAVHGLPAWIRAALKARK